MLTKRDIRFHCGDDRASNKLYERALHAESRSSLYQPVNNDGTLATGYDSANRLRQYQRGILSSTIVPYLAGPGASISAPITLPGTDQARTYNLDGVGNWKTTTYTLVGSGGSTTSTAESRQNNYVNEITTLKDTTGGTTTSTPFTYGHGNNTNTAQGNGNLTNDGTLTYQWDAFNRLIQIGNTSTSAVLATYVYDALGRRIQKTINNLSGGNGGITGDIPAGTTSYLYDGQQIVEERNATAPTTWTMGYFWGQYVDELVVIASAAGLIGRILSDMLYRGTALVYTSNQIAEVYDTDAYGNTLCYSGPGSDGQWFTNDDVSTNNPVNHYIFTGRQFDPESKNYYYRARYYKPALGRFLSRDPIGELGGINLYSYALNNPCRFMDSSGLLPLGRAAQACFQALQNLANAVANLLQRELENTPCPDPGHDKAIEQAKQRVQNAQNDVNNKCGDPQIYQAAAAAAAAAIAGGTMYLLQGGAAAALL